MKNWEEQLEFITKDIRVKQFIKDLRQRDRDELIKRIPEKQKTESKDWFLNGDYDLTVGDIKENTNKIIKETEELIKDYYKE